MSEEELVELVTGQVVVEVKAMMSLDFRGNGNTQNSGRA